MIANKGVLISCDTPLMKVDRECSACCNCCVRISTADSNVAYAWLLSRMIAAKVASNPTCDVEGCPLETLPDRNSRPENLPWTKSGSVKRVFGSPVEAKNGSLLRRFALTDEVMLAALMGCGAPSQQLLFDCSLQDLPSW